MLRRSLAGIAGVVGAVLAFGGSLGAMAAAAAAPALTINGSVSAAVAASPFTVGGAGCTSIGGAPVSVEVQVRSSTSAVAFTGASHPGSSGSWTLNVPAQPSGTYQVAATCDQYNRSFSYAARTVRVTDGICAAISVECEPDHVATLRASSSTVSPGDSITVTGQHFRPGEQVRVVLHSQPVVLATFVADAAGTVSGEVRIPADTTLGRHELQLVGATSVPSPPLGLQVVALADTGVSVEYLGGTGLGLIVLGSTAIVGAAWRRHPRPQRV